MELQHIQNAMRVLTVSLILCLGTMGCLARKPLLRGANLAPGCHTLTMKVDGFERTYIVIVPPSYDPRTKSPLVVVLHGGGDTAKSAIWTTGWAEKADMAGFLAVFPNAMSRDPSRRSSFSGNPQLWNDGSDRFYPDQKATNDVSFINGLLDDLSDRFSVDKKRNNRISSLLHAERKKWASSSRHFQAPELQAQLNNYKHSSVRNLQNARVRRLRFGRCIGKNRPMNPLKYLALVSGSP